LASRIFPSSAHPIQHFVISLPANPIFPAYLTRNDILVAAVSVREHDSSCVLQKPHMNAVVAACFVVRLVVGPIKIFFDSDFIRASAPSPLSFAVSLGAAGPVIQIVLPVN